MGISTLSKFSFILIIFGIFRASILPLKDCRLLKANPKCLDKRSLNYDAKNLTSEEKYNMMIDYIKKENKIPKHNYHHNELSSNQLTTKKTPENFRYMNNILLFFLHV